MKQKNYSIRDIDETLGKIRKKWFDDCEILENKIIPAMKLLGYDLSVVEWTRKAFEKIDSAEYALLSYGLQGILAMVQFISRTADSHYI